MFYFERGLLLLCNRMPGWARSILHPHKGDIISTVASSDLSFGSHPSFCALCTILLAVSVASLLPQELYSTVINIMAYKRILLASRIFNLVYFPFFSEAKED